MTHTYAPSKPLRRLAWIGLASAVLSAAPVHLAVASSRFTLPDYPYWSNDTFVIDEAIIAEYADDYCARAGAAATVEDFFYGDLALRSIDALGMDPEAAEDIDALLGNLYISGYFGGIWLRDSLEDTGGTRMAPGSTLALQHLNRSAQAGQVRDHLIFSTLTAVVQKQVALALEGTPGAVLLANRSTLPSFLYLYGYNLGYIDVLLQYPPPGTPSQEGKLVCGDFLDCSSPAFELEVLERFSPALSSLAAPSNARWHGMGRVVEQYGVSSMEDGQAVWEDILSESTVSSAAYDPLMDLSVGYLLVSEAAVLAGMTAWAEGDIDAGRSGLLLQSGLSLWSGAYFMGLASSAAVGTSPTLTCGN